MDEKNIHKWGWSVLPAATSVRTPVCGPFLCRSVSIYCSPTHHPCHNIYLFKVYTCQIMLFFVNSITCITEVIVIGHRSVPQAGIRCALLRICCCFFLYFWWPLRASCVNLHTAARAAGNHTHKQNKIMLSPFIALTYWFCSVFFIFFILSGLQNWRTADLLWESTRVSEERAGVLFLQVRERHSTHLATL